MTRVIDGVFDEGWRLGRLVALDEAEFAVLGTRPEDHQYTDSDRECDCPYCCDAVRGAAAIATLRKVDTSTG